MLQKPLCAYSKPTVAYYEIYDDQVKFCPHREFAAVLKMLYHYFIILLLV
ncbi:hypothetical protein Ngar_c08330 [Candidatus Nitrososphaera gargensis Ga9.2]|uniref:Uncharacterized protein n=1 Tax=Nitrososphaera gargensis (strain Ga9.2) TaxID=1237085 RepID=K0IDL5_NITGG|nr:hypothetical protein Ngar_c08330 [Candidatus Nitrososphaera gargensis Ga9.2]